MQLKAIKQILDIALPDLVLYHQDTSKNNTTYWLFIDVPRFKQALSLVKQTGLFVELINQIEAGELYGSGSAQIMVSTSEGKIVEDQIIKLRTLAREFSDNLTSVVGETIENAINIKVPNINDFDDLAEISSTLQTILSQVIINDEINGEIQIRSVENGSIWIEVGLGTVKAVSIIGSLTLGAALAYKRIQEGRLMAAKAEKMNMENDRYKKLREHEDAHIELLMEIEAKAVECEFFNIHENDRYNRIKHSLKLLTDLMTDKGVEIHPALNAPEEVKAIFPNLKNLATLERQVKKITNPAADEKD